jgi:regulator of protease activity HflC (stomatin/prohibitin superfamily)
LLSEAQRDSQFSRGVADAEASRTPADAYGQDPEFFDFYRSLQVYRAGLATGAPTVLLGCAGFARAENASPFLDLDADARAKLDDKNLQVGPPDEEIVQACAALSRRALLG